VRFLCGQWLCLLLFSAPVHAPMLWAQREKLLYLTIAVEDFKIEKLDVTETTLTLK
jgi:hypothetical protein